MATLSAEFLIALFQYGYLTFLYFFGRKKEPPTYQQSGTVLRSTTMSVKPTLAAATE